MTEKLFTGTLNKNQNKIKNYQKVPKFSDARKICCNLPYSQAKRPKFREFYQSIWKSFLMHGKLQITFYSYLKKSRCFIAHIGELIGYSWSGVRPSSVVHNAQRSSSPKPPIYGQNPSQKSSSPEPAGRFSQNLVCSIGDSSPS